MHGRVVIPVFVIICVLLLLLCMLSRREKFSDPRLSSEDNTVGLAIEDHDVLVASKDFDKYEIEAKGDLTVDSVKLKGVSLQNIGKDDWLRVTDATVTQLAGMQMSELNVSGKSTFNNDVVVGGKIVSRKEICVDGSCISEEDLSRAMSKMKQDCEVGNWSQWSTCNKTCGGGTQMRSRNVVRPAKNGGAECGALSESQACNVEACPSPPQQQSQPQPPPQQQSQPSQPQVVQQPQQSQPAPNGCQVSDWSAWGACDKTCGGGKQTRTRTVKQQPGNGGKACASLEESQACNMQECITDTLQNDGILGTDKFLRSSNGLYKFIMQGDGNAVLYGPRGAMWASNTAGKRGRSIKMQNDGNLVIYDQNNAAVWACCLGLSNAVHRTKPEFKTAKAPFKLVMQNDGNLVMYDGRNLPVWDTQPIGCEVSAWSAWSACDKSCGGGTQKRTRTVTKQADGGQACPVLEEIQPCNQQGCPVDCAYTDWTSWSSCTKSCGGGIQERTRQVTRNSANGGKACPHLREEQACNGHGCPVDCVYTESGWSACSKSCGGGTQKRTRTITRAAANGGKACPATEESMACNTHACPVQSNGVVGGRCGPDFNKRCGGTNECCSTVGWCGAGADHCVTYKRSDNTYDSQVKSSGGYPTGIWRHKTYSSVEMKFSGYPNIILQSTSPQYIDQSRVNVINQGNNVWKNAENNSFYINNYTMRFSGYNIGDSYSVDGSSSVYVRIA